MISVLIITIIAVALIIVNNGEESIITFFDSRGNQIACDSVSNFANNENFAYLDATVTEAIEILATTYAIPAEDAKSKLLENNYLIHTNFDEEISKNLKSGCEKYGDKVKVGGAIINLDGDLLAVVSVSKDVSNSINYSLEKNAPCSAFKPLAIYAPAIEKNIINWSTTFNDSPYTQLKNADGTVRDWPSNSTGTYTHENVTINKSISKSLNTVAVKCLSKYGVNNSLRFLENSFGIALDYEKEQAKKFEEDEVIGNIALGSTSQGFSTVDMAGYYQIFANGGIYTSPKAIVKIVDESGKIIYERKKENKQVISKETAKIMNELLQTVVKDPEGTGKKAFSNKIPVAGKTGTGDRNADNWFVGVTPEYSCAIWHSDGMSNTSAEIFAGVFENIKHKKLLFPNTMNVTKKIYCRKSGNLVGKNCTTFNMGYYKAEIQIPYCNNHN